MGFTPLITFDHQQLVCYATEATKHKQGKRFVVSSILCSNWF